MLRRFPGWLTAVAVLALLAGAAVAQDEGRETPNEEPSSNATLFDRTDSGNVVQAAMMSYGSGERELKRARKLEGKLPGLSGKKLESAEKNITKAYANAVGAFQDAIRTNPKMVEAYVGLGKAYRGSGQFAESLQVSARGLQLAPEDDDLFAGWAESIMGLNMLGDATQAYTQLAETNPTRADMLMGVMKDWLAERQTDPGDLPPEAVTRLAEWINEQESAS